jgi:hypothetical protein
MTCETCHGEGVLEKDGRLVECFCAFVRRRASSMPEYVRRAPVLPEHIDHPVTEMEGSHVHLVACLSDIHSIIKVMLLKHPKLFIKMTTDAEIKNAHVGSMSRAAKSSDYVGDDVYNNIQDLVGPPDLLIILLGSLGTKNKTASAALLEAINHRIDSRRPVWTLSNSEKPFTRQSPSWSEDVESTIRGFRKIRIPRITPVPPSIDDEAEESIFADVSPSQIAQPQAEVGVSEVGQGVAVKKEKKDWKSQKLKAEVMADDNGDGLSIYGSGTAKSNKRGKRTEY